MDFDELWAKIAVAEVERMSWRVFNNTGPPLGLFPTEDLARTFAAALPGTNTVIQFDGAAKGTGVTRFRDGERVFP